MKPIYKMSTLLLVCFFSLAIVMQANAFFLDFENGIEGGNVSNIAGISFKDYNGFTAKYDDIRTNNYNYWNFYSENLNKSSGSGLYHMFGNFAISAGINADARGLVVDFTNNDGTFFKTGYSMYSANGSLFHLEAHFTDGSVKDVTGSSTIKTVNGQYVGGPMNFLTVNATTSALIDYVVLHDTGNYWIVDNMSGDASGVGAPVPEPSTLLLLGGGLAGLAFWRRKKAVNKE